MKRKIILSILILVCVLIILTYVSLNLILEEKPDEKYEVLSFTYQVEISTNCTGEYSVVVPTPIWFENKTEAKFVSDKMDIKSGNGQYNFSNTENGIALIIQSNDSIKLEAKGQMRFLYGRKPRLILSMQIDTDPYTELDGGDVQHFVKCEKKYSTQIINLYINLDTWYDHGNSDFHYTINSDTTLDEGWQIIMGYAQMFVE